METKEATKKKQDPRMSAISKKLLGDDPLTPDYLYCLQAEGIIDLQEEKEGSFLDFSVKKTQGSSSEMWTRTLKKLRIYGFFEVVRGEWSNSWINGEWSDRVVF